MLHCRDDLAETLRAVQRIACIRRRLRRSLFRLCGRHANWKRPPDALQLPARGPAAARSLLRTRSALPFRRSQLGASIHSARWQSSGREFIFYNPTSLYYPAPHAYQVLLPAPARAPCPTVWRGQGARTPSPRVGGEAREPPLYTVTAGRTRLGLLRRVHRQRPRPCPPVRVRYTAS